MHACNNDLTQKPGLQCTAILICTACMTYSNDLYQKFAFQCTALIICDSRMTYSNDLYQGLFALISAVICSLVLYLYLSQTVSHPCCNACMQ